MITKEQVIELIRNHAKFGCDKMENDICPRLIVAIYDLYERDKIEGGKT